MLKMIDDHGFDFSKKGGKKGSVKKGSDTITWRPREAQGHKGSAGSKAQKSAGSGLNTVHLDKNAV